MNCCRKGTGIGWGMKIGSYEFLGWMGEGFRVSVFTREEYNFEYFYYFHFAVVGENTNNGVKIIWNIL